MYPLSSSVSTPFQKNYHLEELLESLDDVLIATDNNFIITKWNKSAERVYGFTAKDAIGKNYHQLLVRKEIIGSSHDEAMKEFKKNNIWKGFLKQIKETGEEVYLESSTTAIKNEDGFTTGYVAIQRDITQKITSEQSLQKFAYLLHTLDESFLIVNQDLKVTFLSPKKNVLRFHDSKYKIGDDALLFIPEDQKPGLLVNYKKAFSGKTISHEANSGGEEETRIYLHITYMPLKNSFDLISHVAVIIKDLTDEKRRKHLEVEQKEAEEQLYRSRILFEQFMENCPLPAWITDDGGLMQYMNPIYLSQGKVTKADIGKNITEIFPKIMADDYGANNRQVLEGNKALTVVEKGVSNDGNLITYLINKFPLQYEDKSMVAGWAIDITEQVKMQSRLEDINISKNRILSVIGHDLRSPLTVINAIGKMMAEGLSDFDEQELAEMIQAITDSSRKAMTLLTDLVLWCQNQNETITHHPQKVDMNEVIEDSSALYSEDIDKKNLSVIFQVMTPTKVYADKEMVKTVMRNFISNAIKFSPAGSNIYISAGTDENTMFISISDEGHGIEEVLRNRILKGANNISTQGTSGEKGIGLGLTLCKDFIEKNNGVMTIHNNQTKGTTFSFSLPLWKESLVIS